MRGFPEELKAWRQKRGLTQAEAAALFELTEAGYANWEVGRKAPRGLTRTRVLEAIREPGSGEAYRELARFTFSLGDNLATLTVRGKRLEPNDFDRLKEAVGRFQALGAESSRPEKAVTVKQRNAAPERASQGQRSRQKRRLARGRALGQAK